MATSYSDILLTDDGDIDLSTDSVIFIDSNQLSLRQRLNMRFAVWQGEWKYNSTFGTPYKSYVGKPTITGIVIFIYLFWTERKS